jgi:rhodanese-related sulfurtransferase
MFDPRRVPAVSATEANQRLEGAGGAEATDRPILVDVREPHEFVKVRAEGAALLPLSTFILRHVELPQDRAILMICNSGARSAQTTAFLLANGWTDVTNVAGGTIAWLQAGLPARHGPLEPGEGDLTA